jgi:hypothetical protein
MEIAQKMREARSRHLLRSSEAAAKQLRVFKSATPITPRKSESSATSQVTLAFSSTKHRPS